MQVLGNFPNLRLLVVRSENVPSGPAFTRQVNRQAVMEAILRGRVISRARMADATGLSKPTVSEIVSDLLAEGWIRQAGETSGRAGRTASLYELNGGAGFTIGIDLGGTKLRGAIADLGGVLLSEDVEPTDVRGGGHVVEQIVRLCRRLADTVGRDTMSRVRSVAVGSPGVLHPHTGRIDLSFNIPTFGDVHLRDELTESLGVPVVVENDVNMAALGERWAGLATDARNFVFIAVGTGIGMGVVADGELRRGESGAAGEIAYLPLGSDPLEPENHRKGAFEEAVAGAAIVRRYREAAAREGGPAYETVPDIFAAADRDEPSAVATVQAVALDLALGIAAAVAVLDPGLVILGGGIGSERIFADAVVTAVPRVTPLTTRVVASRLGHRAALVGAVSVGLRAAHEGLFVAGSSQPWPLPAPPTERSPA